MGKHGFEDVDINAIRNELRELGVVDEEVLKQSKLPLVALLLEKRTEAKEDDDEDELHIELPDNLNDIIEEDEKNTALEETEEQVTIEDIPEVRPDFGTPRWHDYVMSQFVDEELDGDSPKCDGLRRVTQELLGPIVGAVVPRNTPPEKSNQGTATVVVGLTIRILKDETHPAFNEQIYMEDIADCNVMNTPEPYNQHQSNSAHTKAEARILRKVLGLRRVISAEENGRKDVDIDEAWNPSEPISDEQINVIDLLGKRIDVDIMSYVNSGSMNYRAIEEVSRSKATTMIAHLNSIVRGKSDKPSGSGKYNPNWRN
jgi:hypothetical protein